LRPDSLDLEDTLGLSKFVLLSPDYGVPSDDIGRPVVGDAVLPFLPHASSFFIGTV
jgi:hypothetical protein